MYPMILTVQYGAGLCLLHIEEAPVNLTLMFPTAFEAPWFLVVYAIRAV